MRSRMTGKYAQSSRQTKDRRVKAEIRRAYVAARHGPHAFPDMDAAVQTHPLDTNKKKIVRMPTAWNGLTRVIGPNDFAASDGKLGTTMEFNTTVSPICQDSWFSVYAAPHLQVPNWTYYTDRYEWFRIGRVTLYIESWNPVSETSGNYFVLDPNDPDAQAGGIGKAIGPTDGHMLNALVSRTSLAGRGSNGWHKFYYTTPNSVWSSVPQDIYNYANQYQGATCLAMDERYDTMPTAPSAFGSISDWMAGNGRASLCAFKWFTKGDNTEECWREYMKNEPTVRKKFIKSRHNARGSRIKMVFPSPHVSARAPADAGSSLRRDSAVSTWSRTNVSDILPVGCGLFRTRGLPVKFRFRIGYDVFFKGAKCSNYQTEQPDA